MAGILADEVVIDGLHDPATGVVTSLRVRAFAASDNVNSSRTGPQLAALGALLSIVAGTVLLRMRGRLSFRVRRAP